MYYINSSILSDTAASIQAETGQALDLSQGSGMTPMYYDAVQPVDDGVD